MPERIDRSENVYTRCGNGYHNKKKLLKTLMVHILIFIIIMISCSFDRELRDVILVIYLCIIFMEGLHITNRYIEGYRADESKIQYYHRLKKQYIMYSGVNSIVVSHARAESYRGYLGKFKRCTNGKIRYFPYPWITLCDTIPEKIIKKYNYTLNGRNVDYLLRKNGLIYSFMWNDWVMENLFTQYKGDFYVTTSIATRYKRKMQAIIDMYRIEKERIHIIPDEVASYPTWNNDF